MAKQQFIKQWLDHLESSLEREAQLVGLYSHSALVGHAREFVIKQILRRILPPVIEVGTGRVIDSEGNSSRQIDIILHDSRYPRFGLDGGIGIYPVESVLATIEVKSEINKSSVIEALDNCRSVMQLQTHVVLEEMDGRRPLDEYINRYAEKSGVSTEESARRAGFQLHPATFVFGLRGISTPATLRDHIQAWYNEHGRPTNFQDRCPALPRVILTDQLIGTLDDGKFRIEDDERRVKVLMAVSKSKRRFGLFACYLLDALCCRVSRTHQTIGTRFVFDHYLPVQEYFSENLAGIHGEYVI